MTTYHMCASALSSLLLLGTGSALAQPAAPNVEQAEQAKKFEEGSAQFQTKVDQAARDLDNDPQLSDLTHQQRKDLIEFVTGNMLFALLHELTHALILEMDLPVLGQMEDAADSYAVIALLKVGTDLSHNILVETARGWFLSAERNQKEGVPLAFYAEHGIDQQRAYEIVCLMVGSDPNRFVDLAHSVKMPKERQESCSADYSNASWSWETVLRSHLRNPDQPKQKIEVAYGSGRDNALIAKVIHNIGLMERVANYAAGYVWPRPIMFDAKSCGQPEVHWDSETKEILVCYEMFRYFADLYRGYGLPK